MLFNKAHNNITHTMLTLEDMRYYLYRAEEATATERKDYCDKKAGECLDYIEKQVKELKVNFNEDVGSNK